MKNKYDELKEDIHDEENSIEEVIIRIRAVGNRFYQKEKDIFTEPAMGTYLMNFYNGIENIIKRVCRIYYHIYPKGASWHKELLNLSADPPEGKLAIFDEDIVSDLFTYLNFRHRFISGYGFQLKGEKMLNLIDNIDSIWDRIKKSIELFFKKLENLDKKN